MHLLTAAERVCSRWWALWRPPICTGNGSISAASWQWPSCNGFPKRLWCMYYVYFYLPLGNFHWWYAIYLKPFFRCTEFLNKFKNFIKPFSFTQVNLKEQGRLLRQGEFMVWEGSRAKKSIRHVFLFEDLILFSKARRDPEKKVRFCCIWNNF